jgi:spermidine/putrescine transport system permease protein
VRRLARAFFLAVPLIWVVVAHLGPLLTMARISLLDVYPGPPGAQPAWSMAAYAAFLENAGFRFSLWRSLWLATATTAAALLVAYPLAYYVAIRVEPARRARRLALLLAPFWTSEVLRLFGLMLLAANRGVVNALLRALGLAPIPMLYGNGAVLAGLLYTVLLTMLMPLYAALERMRPEVLAAAATLGARAGRRFWQITLPLSAPGVMAGIVLTFLASTGIFAAPALLGGAATPVFATTIVDLFGASSGRWPMGAAFGFILLAVGTAAAVGLGALAPGLWRARTP